MGAVVQIGRMFGGVTYNQFTSTQVKEKMVAKVAVLSTQITDREGRIEREMAEHHLTAEVLADILMQYMRDREKGREAQSYSNSIQPQRAGAPVREVTVQAGVLAKLVTERDLIASAREEIARLELIARNLRPRRYANHPQTGEAIEPLVFHTLSDADMEYLGF